MTPGGHNMRSRARGRVLVTGCVLALVAAALATSANPSRADRPPGNCSALPLVGGREAPIVYRPPGLSTAQKVPLLVALHGSGGNPAEMDGLTHFEQVAHEHGFVVAYPAACNLADPWSASQDLTYISSLINRLTASQNIDPSRVYVTGFSAGGYETWRVACLISRQVAAIAIVSDAMSKKTVRVCSLAHPISQLLIVGTANGYIYAGIPGLLPSAVQTTAWWRSVDGCASAPVVVRQVSTVIEQTWPACRGGTAVALYKIQGAVHVWPPYGTGAPTNYPTSEAVWAFLSAHRAAPFSGAG
jgi:polyhydroxybutyrate depolymerase